MTPHDIDLALSALCGWEPACRGAVHALDTVAAARTTVIKDPAARVKFSNALRTIIGKRESIPKNKLGQPLVSDYDMLDSTAAEQVEAILRAFGKWQEAGT